MEVVPYSAMNFETLGTSSRKFSTSLRKFGTSLTNFITSQRSLKEQMDYEKGDKGPNSLRIGCTKFS